MVFDLFDADGLTGEDQTEIDLLAPVTDASACCDGDCLAVERVVCFRPLVTVVYDGLRSDSALRIGRSFSSGRSLLASLKGWCRRLWTICRPECAPQKPALPRPVSQRETRPSVWRSI